VEEAAEFWTRYLVTPTEDREQMVEDLDLEGTDAPTAATTPGGAPGPKRRRRRRRRKPAGV
jgi:hypothetical protein